MQALQRRHYENCCRIADEGYTNGRVSETSASREKYWYEWVKFLHPFNFDPYVGPDTPHERINRFATMFAGEIRAGGLGKGQTIKADSVSQGLSAVNQIISLTTGRNPFKVAGSDKLFLQ